MHTYPNPRSRHGLKHHGICASNAVYWNLPTGALMEEAVRRREGRIGHLGPLVVRTGQHTARAAGDKFVVKEPSCDQRVDWNGVHRAIRPSQYHALKDRLLSYWRGRDLFVQDCFCGADPAYQLPIRIVTETAWHSLFARNMFIQPQREQLPDQVPQFTMLHAPSFHAIPETDGTGADVFVVINFAERVVLIGGTQYAGEIKDAFLTIMGLLLPRQNVLPMRCAANVGADDDVALFVGLSGTGKTTLAADPDRSLIGDDGHGWSERGVFHLESGCYPKVINLSRECVPDIYETTRRFGTILENVGFDPVDGRIDLHDGSLTENTRAAYPMSHMPGALREGVAGHPRHLFMLTTDATGVLPPIAKLTPQKAIAYYLMGYSGEVAGTQRGVMEPRMLFSSCFGVSLMPLAPAVYARMLAERIRAWDVDVWLLNTGWTGGPYGVGSRMRIEDTRAMVRAAVDGALADVPTRRDPVFDVDIPTSCPGVSGDLLDPRCTWLDAQAYDERARKLLYLFEQHQSRHTSLVEQADATLLPQMV